MDKWKIIGHVVGDRDISDYAPIWVKSNNIDWGPKPFRVNSCLFENKEFLKFVEDDWKRIMMYVKQAYILKENIKLLRGSLRKWNKDVFGWLDLKIEYVAKEFNRLDETLINNELMRDDTIEEIRKEAIEEFWRNLHL